MTTPDTSEMDFLESELSILNISGGIEEVKSYQIFKNFIEQHTDLIAPIAEEDKVLIVLSPLSGKHSFERKWVTKRELSSIVERPQRILACAIGISAAFSLAPSSFNIIKSYKEGSLYAEHVTAIHGLNWAKTLIQLCEDSIDKLARRELEVPSNWPTGDIYLNPDTIEALQGVIGSVETAVDQVYGMGYHKAMIVVRPPGHHSHPCSPSGFCLINNVQIAIQYAFETQQVTHAVILDIDLHHGDGSQEICWKRGGWKLDGDDEDRADFDDYYKRAPIKGPKVGYFSLHDINSFPTEQGMAYVETIKNASTCIMNHDAYIWNVHLEQYQSLEEFESLYETKYKTIISKALEFLKKSKIKQPENFKPLIMISAGFDASEYETVKMQRHQVNLPTSFYHKFSNDVCTTFLSEFKGSKVVSILEGGYSNEALCSGIFSHLMGLQNLTWKEEYGSKETVKELVKGCKPHWKSNPAVKPAGLWHQEVIELGRVLCPESIIEDKPPPSSNGELTENILDRLRSHHNKSV